ncbi:MAG: hypothetical protein RIS47_1220, partial [Bacteroidota bacterium]
MKTIEFIRNIVTIVSLRKVGTLVLSWLAYRLYPLNKNLLQYSQPYAISFEPTSRCNLSCPECPTGLGLISRKQGFAEMDTFRNTIDAASRTAFVLVLYVQGEPFLHKSLPEMITYGCKKGLFTMTSTNGHFLDSQRVKKIVDAGLHRLIVSVDGLDEEAYKSYRKGGSLPKVLEGIRKVVAYKNEQKKFFPIVELQFLVLSTNEHQLPSMRKLAKDLGVRLRVKTAQFQDFKNGNALMPKNMKYSRYRLAADGTYSLPTLRKRCWRMWANPAVTWDGTVMPCCFDKDANYAYGNINFQNFRAIWQNNIRASFA